MSVGHKLTNVLHQIGGWTGECSCGKWVGTAKTKPGLAAKHYGHVKESRGKG